MARYDDTPETQRLFKSLSEANIPQKDRGERVEWPLLQHAAALERRLIKAEGIEKERLDLENSMLRCMISDLQKVLREAADYVRIAVAEEDAINAHRRYPRHTESRFLKVIEEAYNQDPPRIT